MQRAIAESTNSRRFRQRMEQLPRGIKIRKKAFISPHPNLLPKGEGVNVALPTCGFYTFEVGGQIVLLAQKKARHKDGLFKRLN
jgi:hypothetical protein